MTTIMELRDYAALADMAYVDLKGVDLNNSNAIIKEASDQERTPEALGQSLLDVWDVDHYYGKENDETGFSATTFRQGNKIVLAIRGTEAGLDQVWQDWISTNFIGIGIYGVAVDQAISLFNYIQRLRAPANQTGVLQLKVDYIDGIRGYTVSTSTNDIGLGIINPGDTIDVIGHSLQ